MNSVLPNMRLICLPSEALGSDWFEKSMKIDASLPVWNMDLAEESVYLIFDRSPGAVMHGEGSCLVARSVIGPKTGLAPPFSLKDWVSSPVFRYTLASLDWSRVFEEAFMVWENLQRDGKNTLPAFSLCIRRRLDPELILEAQVIFTQ